MIQLPSVQISTTLIAAAQGHRACRSDRQCQLDLTFPRVSVAEAALVLVLAGLELVEAEKLLEVDTRLQGAVRFGEHYMMGVLHTLYDLVMQHTKLSPPQQQLRDSWRQATVLGEQQPVEIPVGLR